MSNWQESLAGRRQHAQKLLIRKERLAEIKFELQIGKVSDVRDVRCVVVRVEPRPRADTIVIIVKDPLDSSDVPLGLIAENSTAQRQ